MITNLVRNREHWLTDLAKKAEAEFKGFAIPPYRVTCGWPCKNATGSKGRRVGECHGPTSSKGGSSSYSSAPYLMTPMRLLAPLPTN